MFVFSNVLLRRVNFILAAVYVAQAVAIPLFGARFYRPVNLYFLTTDTIQAKLTGQSVSALALHQLLSINLAWLVSAWLIIMAVIQLALATINRKEFESGGTEGGESAQMDRIGSRLDVNGIQRRLSRR